MPFVSECPSCGQKLKVPDNLSGKRVKCSKCASVFVAESVTATPPAAAPPPSRRRDEEPDERLDDEPTDNGDYEDEGRPSRRRSRRGGGAAGRGGMLLTFGIVSIAMPILAIVVQFVGGLIFPPIALCSWVFIIVGLVLGIMAWVMGSGDLKKIKAGTISQEAQGGTKGGFITGIIGTILNVLYFVCGCIGVILLLVFGVAILGAASANQQKGAPAFPVGPGPARRSFQLPLPKLAEYLPNRGR